MGRAAAFVFVALSMMTCLVHCLHAADAAPREARPLSAKDLRIDPKVGWQRMSFVDADGRPLEGQPKSVLNVWVTVRGEAAAQATACGDFLVDSVKDENGNPVPRSCWMCTRGLLWRRADPRQPEEGVEMLFQLRDPPPLKKLSELRGSSVLRTGGRLQEVVVKDFLKPNSRAIDNATLKALGVAVVTTRIALKPAAKSAPAPRSFDAPDLMMPDAVDEVELDITSGDSPVVQIAITDPGGESLASPACRYDTGIRKATFLSKEKLPDDSQLRVTVHRDAQEMQVPVVLRDLEVPLENEPYPKRPPASRSAQPLDVVVEELRATRSNTEFQEFKTGLDVTLKVSGTEFDKAADSRCRLTKAVDDTGADLIRADNNPLDSSIFGHVFHLKLPARKAQVIEDLSGVVELLLPERDPQATIKVTGFVARPSVKVSHPTLTAHGATLTIVSKAEFDRLSGMPRDGVQNFNLGGPPPLELIPRMMTPDTQKPPVKGDADAKGDAAAQAVEGLLGSLFGGFGINENSVIVIQKDPKQRIWKIEFSNASGEPISIRGTQGGSHFSDDDTPSTYTAFSFDKKLPENAVMRILVATPKAVKAVPFSLKNVMLP